MPVQKKTKSQQDKFTQKARELSCDEYEAAFEDRLRRIVPKHKRQGMKVNPATPESNLDPRNPNRD